VVCGLAGVCALASTTPFDAFIKDTENPETQQDNEYQDEPNDFANQKQAEVDEPTKQPFHPQCHHDEPVWPVIVDPLIKCDQISDQAHHQTDHGYAYADPDQCPGQARTAIRGETLPQFLKELLTKRGMHVGQNLTQSEREVIEMDILGKVSQEDVFLTAEPKQKPIGACFRDLRRDLPRAIRAKFRHQLPYPIGLEERKVAI
jgi:hypothetical protein